MMTTAAALSAGAAVDLPSVSYGQVKAGAAKPYGTDPDLQKVYRPGDLWPLTFDARQIKAAGALADVILPADDLGPAASTLGVVDMLDEWVSAPNDTQQKDRPVILDGLAWIDAESRKRFQKDFADLPESGKTAICDAICDPAKAVKEFRTAARFFSKFRALCAGAYYATPDGWKALGYVGNVALASFDGPPPEVLAQLGVEQTVV